MYKAKPLAKVRLMDLSKYWTWLWARRNWILKKATDHRIGYYFWLNFEPTFQLLFHKYAVHTFCSFHNCDKINKKATKYSHYNEALKSFFKHLILTLSHLVLVCNKECFIWARIVFCDGLQRPDLRFLTSNIIYEAHLLRKVAILKN